MILNTFPMREVPLSQMSSVLSTVVVVGDGF